MAKEDEFAAEVVEKTDREVNIGNGERNADAEANETASESPSLTPKASREGVRRASGKGKIANLRAAFERKDEGPANNTSPNSTPRRVVSRDQDTSVMLLREQHTQDLAKLRVEHEAALDRGREPLQHEISQLKQQLDQQLDLRQAYEEKFTALEDRIDALQADLSTQTTQHQIDIDLHSREKTEAQKGAITLQQQILELKRTIAAVTRVENQVSDSTLSQDFRNLFHELQNWVANNFRKAKVEKTPDAMVSRLESIAEPKQLDFLRPIYSHFDASIRISAFQATAACCMMEIWEEPLLFGLPVQQDFRKGLKRATETLPSVLLPVTFNTWRADTLNVLRQAQGIAESVDSAVASLSEMIYITLNTLADAESSEAQLSSLNTIIKRAVTLSHLFKVQRAQYQFRLPAYGEIFVSETMEDVSVDTEPLDGRRVQCATFPTIVKLGDENGDNVEISNVIVKAKVLLRNG